MGEWGRLTAVEADQLDRPGLDVPQHRQPAIQVGDFMKTIVYRLPNDRLIGNFHVADDIFLAGGLGGEDRGQQILGPHALQVRRHAPALHGPPELQRPRHVPPPARPEKRHRQKRLHKQLAGQAGRYQLEHLLQRKAMLGAEREDDAVVVGRGLELEIKGPAKALAQGQAPGPVDPRSERCVNHQLHSAGFVEEALEEEPLLGRHHAGGGVLRGDVSGRLLCSMLPDLTVLHQPVHSRPGWRRPSLARAASL